jgi:hypothetical protein
MPPATDRLVTPMGGGTILRAGNQADRNIVQNYSEVDHD